MWPPRKSQDPFAEGSKDGPNCGFRLIVKMVPTQRGRDGGDKQYTNEPHRILLVMLMLRSPPKHLFGELCSNITRKHTHVSPWHQNSLRSNLYLTILPSPPCRLTRYSMSCRPCRHAKKLRPNSWKYFSPMYPLSEDMS